VNELKFLGKSKIVQMAKGRSLRVTLLIEVAEALKVKKGDSIVFIQDEQGHIYIEKG